MIIEKYKSGDWNSMTQVNGAKGSVIITFTKRNDERVYRFCVKDLYGAKEKVLWEEVISEEKQ